MNKNQIVKFRDFASINAGQSPKSEYYSKNEGIPFLQGNRTFGRLYPEIDTYTKKVTKIAQKGDILMSVRAPVGDLNFAKEKVCIGRGLAAISAKDNNNKFLFYCLMYNIENLIKQSGGTTYNSVNKDIINDFDLVMPITLDERLRVANILSTIDKKIELNNQINSELESMAKLIYDYWFVQYDFLDENGKPYKSSGGKMVYNGELKREVPEGWKAKKIDEILKTELGGTPSTKIDEYWNGEYPWLNSGEITNFPIIDSELKVTESGISNSATSLMSKGTCVLSITRHLRPSILAVDSCANQSVVGIFESDLLKSSYIYPYLVNEIPRLMSLRTGAQQPHINKGVVDESPMLIPEEPVLNNYYATVNPMYNEIINKTFQNKELSELKDWLLPMLMNGQVTVN